LDHNVSAVDRCLRRSGKASDQAKVFSFWGEGCVLDKGPSSYVAEWTFYVKSATAVTMESL